MKVKGKGGGVLLIDVSLLLCGILLNALHPILALGRLPLVGCHALGSGVNAQGLPHCPLEAAGLPTCLPSV